MHFDYRLVPEWPQLAWVARLCAGTSGVQVAHGRSVHCTDAWLAEGAWAGAFEDGDLDRTEIVCGSGARLRNSHCVFVSPGCTTDRLWLYEAGDTRFVTNSLACLDAVIDVGIDPAWPGYVGFFRGLRHGIDRHQAEFHSDHGRLRIVMHRNLRWDGESIAWESKPHSGVAFSNFATYRRYLADSMRAVFDNAAAVARSLAFCPVATVSSGYDSVAATALAAEAGCSRSLSFEHDRDGDDDSGAFVAAALGLAHESIPLSAWRGMTRPEIPFLAANALGEEVRFFALADQLSGTLVITGFHGDKVWAREPGVNAELRRGDMSGSSLAEFRLAVGFAHCPVPFWGARQLAEIAALGSAPEMAPWSIGGDYDRPIPRRIGEQAGVAREAFGQSKKMGSQLRYRDSKVLTGASMQSFEQWLRANRVRWIRRRQLPPLASGQVDQVAASLRRRVGDLVVNVPVVWRARARLDRPTRLRGALLPWALREWQAQHAGDASAQLSSEWRPASSSPRSSPQTAYR